MTEIATPSRLVTISGRRFQLDSAEVERAVRQVLPEPIREHFVVIGGRRFAPKQVICLVTGLDRADFTTHQARRILTRLGFPAARRAALRSQSGAAATRSSSPVSRVESLRPYMGQWVATQDDEVLVAASSAAEVVAWLAQHGKRADSMLRVPEDEAAASGIALV